MDDDDERTARLAALSGRYGVHAQADVPARTQALPTAVRWLLGGLVAVVVLGGVVRALVKDGTGLAEALLPGSGLRGVPWEALLVVGGGYLLVRWLRSGEARTDVAAHELVVSAGRRQRRVGWHEVSAVEPARRFAWWPTAVLADGTRLELPGVPPEVADQLAELFSSPTRQPPPTRSQGDDADGGWDGPFRTGRG